MNQPFWKTIPLSEMSDAQWEALCDGCGKCCLLKLEDEDSGEIAYTRLHCRLLDGENCRCKDYKNRKAKVPDCMKLTPEKLAELKWMPKSCAYRLIHEGKDLPDWHYLKCGDRQRIHKEGYSIAGKTLCEDSVLDEDLFDWIVDWEAD